MQHSVSSIVAFAHDATSQATCPLHYTVQHVHTQGKAPV